MWLHLNSGVPLSSLEAPMATSRDMKMGCTIVNVLNVCGRCIVKCPQDLQKFHGPMM